MIDPKPQRRKLIEVALPLEAINRESAREKSIRHGHPSTLHLWWARRPLAACRAVLFASLVDDPSSLPEEFPTEEAQEKERQRLFGIIEELVKWDNSNNEDVLGRARKEIMRSTDGNPPPVLDPFCGGGSIPLEAQRLGLEAHASDLNPVAVLITKALIEIPPKFANRSPVNPESRMKLTHGMKWKGAQGLAEDVRYYGKWMRDEAEKRIGHLYPKVKMENGREATVIAWLWARTVKCPNPACGAEMPLVRAFALSTKKGKEFSIEPRTKDKRIDFQVIPGPPRSESPKSGRGANFRCLACGASTDERHIKAEGAARRMGAAMLAIVAEGDRSRVYTGASEAQLKVAHSVVAPDTLHENLAIDPRNIWCTQYGLTEYRDLFSSRQLVALTTFSDLVEEARERVLADAKRTMTADGGRLADGGTGADAYADAVTTYLAFGVNKATNRNCTLSIWETGMNRLAAAFGRQAIPMTWDFAETNPFAGAGGDIEGTIGSVAEVVENLGFGQAGSVVQLDARALDSPGSLFSTDPPYYDNIGYADLSDFFYVWLRRSLRQVFPQLTSTILTPKAQELIATPYRHEGDKNRAKEFFESGSRDVFERIKKSAHPDYPITVYYAFKQAETGEGDSTASTGWETMLDGLVRSGLSVVGTWPVRSELLGALKKDIGVLASSIVLVCRRREVSASIATRREFINALKSELPKALKNLQHGSIAPVDLAQASIGPGMAVFTRYAKVIEADGSPMRVRSALQLINQALDEVLSEQESEYDADTQWAVAWFSQFGMKEAAYGEAETLSKAKNTSVRGLEEAGVLRSGKGKVQLLSRDQIDTDWDPATDKRLTIWEVTQHLIRRLQTGGESSAADLLRKIGGMGEIARDLAYRLYSICERKGWSDEAIHYNSLVVAWPEITKAAAGKGTATDIGQAAMFKE
jgi:putative DNA methylase